MLTRTMGAKWVLLSGVKFAPNQQETWKTCTWKRCCFLQKCCIPQESTPADTSTSRRGGKQRAILIPKNRSQGLPSRRIHDAFEQEQPCCRHSWLSQSCKIAGGERNNRYEHASLVGCASLAASRVESGDRRRAGANRCPSRDGGRVVAVCWIF